MPESITYLHQRSIIDKLSKKERDELLKQLIDNDIDLTREEENYLTNEQMRHYVGKLFTRMIHPTAYELSFADDTEKDIFVLNPVKLEILIPIMNSLDETWREKILTQAVFSNKGLLDSVFETLSDKDKRFYANLSIVNSDYPSAMVIKYMNTMNQKSIIHQLKNRGEALDKEHFDNLTKESQKYYLKMEKERKDIKESVRKFIRKIINETVSAPGTVFGPYHDKVVLDKVKTKPQYFSVALNRAAKICSNPEVSSDVINCPVDYEIEKTKHSVERQFRHAGDTIEDEKLKFVINKGIDKIIKLLLSNGIKVGDRVHLKDKSSDLNVVLELELDKTSSTDTETVVRFVVITVMNKRNFVSYEDVPTIFV